MRGKCPHSLLHILFIPSFIHYLIQQMFIGDLLCATHCNEDIIGGKEISPAFMKLMFLEGNK